MKSIRFIDQITYLLEFQMVFNFMSDTLVYAILSLSSSKALDEIKEFHVLIMFYLSFQTPFSLLVRIEI